MGDFVFSKSFNMLQMQRWHHIITRLQRAISLLGPFSPSPWLIHVAFHIVPPFWALRDWFDSVAWCQNEMCDRLADKQRRLEPDLAHYLMMEEDEENAAQVQDAMFWLNGDSLLAIVAGR